MSALVLTFPTAEALRRAEQVLVPELSAADPVFSILPVREIDAHIISWVQKDNYTGLQALRGLGGAPSRVNRVGDNRYTMTPGVYGEYISIDELVLTAKADPVTMRPIDLTTEVSEAQLQLLQRRLDRIKYIAWNVLQGRFSVANGRGVIHTDAYEVQSSVVGTSWATYTTSTPLADLLEVRTTFARGRSCSFGADAMLYGNSSTISDLFLNSNAADLGGRKLNNSSVMGVGDVNTILNSMGLPSLFIYDGGYYTEDTDTWNMFIPDGVLILVGKRQAETAGYYAMTRNGQTGQPGSYSFVKDDTQKVPRSPEVHDGHNGGPCLEYPGDIVVITTRP